MELLTAVNYLKIKASGNLFMSLDILILFLKPKNLFMT